MKKIIIVLLVLVTLVFSGCQGGETAQSSDGLTITFEENRPPAKVIDNNQDSFEIAVNVKNEGDADVGVGRVIATLSGIDSSKFNINSLTSANRNAISGKSKESGEKIAGGIETIEFGQASYNGALTDDFTTTLKADVCYDYETEAVFDLCLKQNAIQKESSKDICKIEESKDVTNSLAPVQVSDVTESSSGNSRITFKISINPLGAGTVYGINTFSAGSGCSEDKGTQKIDRVEMIVEPQSNVAVSCGRLNSGNQGEVRLYDENNNVVCDIDTSSLQETAFNSPIKVKLRYMYMDSVEKELTVKKS